MPSPSEKQPQNLTVCLHVIVITLTVFPVKTSARQATLLVVIQSSIKQKSVTPQQTLEEQRKRRVIPEY